MVWLLSPQSLETLVRLPGSIGHISHGTGGANAGIWIAKQLYDGVNPQTKGEVPEFWKWNEMEKRLIKGP